MAQLGADRLRLTRLEQERIDLGYLGPTEPGFGQNLLSARLGAGEADGPVITLYGRPSIEVAAFDLGAVYEWLTPNSHRYEPYASDLFVPIRRRMITDGVLAYEEFNEYRFTKYLVTRRTGSVEYASDWAFQREFSGRVVWLVSSRRLAGTFWQYLAFLKAFGTGFLGGVDWRILVNIQNAAGAYLTDFGRGWENDLRLRDATTALDPHAQIDLAFDGGAEQIPQVIREFATRVEFVFGFHLARIYNNWEPKGEFEPGS